MRIPLSFLLLALPLLLPAQTRPVDLVDPFTGTSNSRWMMNPGPGRPFGMVKLGPDNQGNVWNGGYEYTNASIAGFSHLHGMSLSGVSYMPTTGEIYFADEIAKLYPGDTDGPYGDMWTAGYRSRILKSTEEAGPGYYKVHLEDYDVGVELTTTRRTGWMRLTYPETEQAHLLLDLDPPAEEQTRVSKTFVRKVSDRAIAGYTEQSNQYAGTFRVYFYSEFDHPLTGIEGWQYEPYTGEGTNYGTDWRRHCRIEAVTDTFRGEAKSGVILNFSTPNGATVLVRTGVSFVSEENARQNLRTESEPFQWDFGAVVEDARREWDGLLSRVNVQSREPDRKALFYTNFYRSFYGKNIVSDVNGQYVDMCEEVRTLADPNDLIFSSDGYWGAQWTVFPFWTLVAPEWSNALARSMLTLADDGGWIPEAPTGVEYAPIMGAQHHNTLIVSLVQKGLANFDPQRAYRAIRHDYTTPGIEHPCGGYAGNRHLTAYLEHGYVPDEAGPVSNTMAYAFDDWCFSELAGKLGHHEDQALFAERGQSYRNVYDPETGYLRRRHADGRWVVPFDPFLDGTEGSWNGAGYMEGNAWMYTWWVPQDLPGLAGLLGEERASDRLEEGFAKGHVNLTNQPNLQAPYLFNYFGKPWLTQRYSRYVTDEFFNLSPLEGWAGEEDEGQMSSLYCLMSMGLFQMKGGCSIEPYYDLGSPAFERIEIRMPDAGGRAATFTITVENFGRHRPYIASATLNGEPLEAPRIPYHAMAAGGELRLRMSAEANEELFTGR